MLDMETPKSDYGLSLQTLHRMPSETWERRPVFPTFFIMNQDALRLQFSVILP